MRTSTLPRPRLAGRAAATAAVATVTAALLTPIAAQAVTPASGPDTGGTRIETPAPGVSSTVTSIASGLYFTLELDSDGSVWSLGDGTLGELGDGTTTRAQLTPVRVEGLPPIAEVEAGDRFAIVRGVDGSVWTWGLGSSGQLGIDDTANQTRPVKVTALADRDIIDVGAGSVHSMAVASDGTVWTWGDNWRGQLGLGTFRGQQTTPQQVPDLTDVRLVAAGAQFAVAGVGWDTVTTWGANDRGQLGDGSKKHRSTPVSVRF
jgi:alpha-tubulin suppressor-like RCC1 family protein